MKWIIFLSLLLPMNFVFASEAEMSGPTMAPSTDLSDKPQVKAPQASMVNRLNLKYQLTVSPLGIEYGNPAGGVSASLGYFLSSYEMLVLRYSNFNGADADNESSRTLRALTLGYRRFEGNSFNFMPTLYYRRSTADYYKENNIFVIGSPNFIFEDIGVGIRVGNEWQWQNFTMGCDWFGLNYTLITLNEQDRFLGIVEDITLQKQLSLTFLNFYIGYSF